MIAIQNANDFEFYSANSAGGIQGYGYQCRNDGCVSERIIYSRMIIELISHADLASFA